jgi:predicted RNA-binding Zn-ribbon protein involved in translation (DUF1610 family)
MPRQVSKIQKPPEPVETKAEFTGGVTAKMFLCPLCGHSREDKDEMRKHIAMHGGEA